ncbi:LysR family transcriptional regulator ArgP [Subtercola frigoramans]|uniref:LysR family transcriptional regulator (Chromosome initiation inhibitor) n=1 Tax=Subtercola frigoramans TaxID=120298 RepID=A0ABS2L639_9MICO|nr:LysR family transcriptional regulator ArgP [Subtercola frigoramans]MBM7472555.1 LysR family transcriptional regulator (chromosome initiation inhibitor) [Subtercola frigoramans]
MMAFQFEQLQTLTTLLEEGTFEKAAIRLHVTASAVSQRIKAMEQAASQILVERTIPVTLTTAGTIVVRYARQVQLLDDDTRRELHLGGSGDSGEHATTIALAVNADSLATWFLESIAELSVTHQLVFDLHRDDQEHTTTLLRSGTVLAAVTSTPEPVQGCTSERLGIMRYRAVCSPAFARRWMIGPETLDRLGRSPMVNFDRKDELQRTFLGAHSDQVPPTHFVPTSADFARSLLLGFGWGLLPEGQCGDDLEQGRLVELDPEHPVDVVLYWQRWNLKSALLDAVTDAVRIGAVAALATSPVE